MKIKSVHESGGNGVIISTETNLANGLPSMVLVGFAGKSLDESKERIRSAFSSSGLTMPRKRITVNVSPSDVPKDGAHYDLAIALSILQEANMIPKLPDNLIVLGELGLDGSIKPVRGLLGKLLIAINNGYSRFIIPTENESQSNLIGGIKVLPATSLKILAKTLIKDPEESFSLTTKVNNKRNKIVSDIDFSDVIGQVKAKRALEIAAAGGHNIILNGPPGVGKSMLAKALPGILSHPDNQEVIEITHLHSLTGNNVTELIDQRPFRSPHHSSSNVSIVGGGQKPKPGEVSLAHNGVLFLDELPEFSRSTIESLRQPLEDKVVTVSRARDSVTFPADFLLIATKNPCPCGFWGSSKACVCTPIELQRYQKKLSGPILDRIDIHVTVDNVEHKKLLSKNTGGESSQSIRERVVRAQKIQEKRLPKQKRNASMSNKEIKQNISLSPPEKEFIDEACKKLDVSARVYMKIIKLARTIADLEGSEEILKKHLAEAIQYRPIKNA